MADYVQHPPRKSDHNIVRDYITANDHVSPSNRSDVWHIAYGIWHMAYSIWHMAYGIWHMEYGIRVRLHTRCKLKLTSYPHYLPP
jgi:hypothetical protein